MLKNQHLQGKASEDDYVKWIESNGGHVYRFEDLFDASKKGKAANRRPSDFLITQNGLTHYHEVKSTSKSSFSFAGIQPEQWRTAHKVTKVNGIYYFVIHFLTENRWFRFPANILLVSEKKSINIKELTEHEIFLISE